MKACAMVVLVGFFLLICFGCTHKQQAAEKPKAPEAPAVNGVQITLKMEKEKYLADEPIYFSVTATYEKDGADLAGKSVDLLPHIIGADGKGIPLISSSVEAGSSLPIRGADGKEIAVPLLRLGLPLSRHLHVFVPSPGQSTWCGGDLRWSADIPPGKYTLQMTALVNNAVGCASNTLSFEVDKEKMKLPEAPVHNNVQVIVLMQKDKYAANDNIAFEVIIKNVDPKTRIALQACWGGGELFYRSTGRLVDASGKELPWDPCVVLAFIGSVALRPGQTYIFHSDLKSAAKIPPGEYTFKLVGNVFSIGEFESNEVKFTVEAPEPTE